MRKRRSPRVLLIVPALLLVALVSHAAPAESLQEEPDGLPSLEAILTRHVLSSGGVDAIRELTTRTATLRCVTDLPSRTPPVYEVDSLSVWSRASGEFLVVWRTQRGNIIEGCDGRGRWRIESGALRRSEHWWGPRDMWLTDPRFPLRLAEYFPNMELVGLEMMGEEWVYVVDVDGDESHRLGFCVETGLLTRLGYNKELRDYRQVDGVLMPMRVVESRKGGSSTFVFDTVTHNDEMDPQIFSLAK